MHNQHWLKTRYHYAYIAPVWYHPRSRLGFLPRPTRPRGPARLGAPPTSSYPDQVASLGSLSLETVKHWKILLLNKYFILTQGAEESTHRSKIGVKTWTRPWGKSFSIASIDCLIASYSITICNSDGQQFLWHQMPRKCIFWLNFSIGHFLVQISFVYEIKISKTKALEPIAVFVKVYLLVLEKEQNPKKKKNCFWKWNNLYYK